MAEASKTPSEANKVPHAGDHDRVAMLSVKADGTLDQHNPELLDREFAEAATRRQFVEQAVSAVDVAERGVSSAAVTIVGKPGDEPDEVIPATTDATGEAREAAELRKKHEAAQKAGEAAAQSVVKSLS